MWQEVHERSYLRANAGMAKEDDGNSEIMMTPRKKPHRILKIFANPLIMPQHILLYVECQGKNFQECVLTLTNLIGLPKLIAKL